MKVLYLTTGCFDKGGISRYCRYQISALRELFGTADVEVLSLLGPDEHGFEVPFEVAWHGRSGGLPDKLEMAARAGRYAISVRPDVIHLAHINLGPLALQLSRLCSARTLLNVYGLEVWSGLSQRRRTAMRGISRIVSDCHFTAQYIVDAGMWSGRPYVIWDCVDLDRFIPRPCSPEVLARYGLPDKRNKFVVLSLGRLARCAAHKGYDRLIEAFAKLRQRQERVHLVIAGQGDDRPRLEDLVARFGLQGNVTFPGPIREQDLADVYRCASVFSLVSDRGPGRGEGIPLTPLEAMSCGVPILVGNQDGSKEAVVERQQGAANGFVLDPFDLDRHAAIMGDLAAAPERLRSMQVNSRLTAEQFFGYQRFVDQHRKLYASFVSRACGLGASWC